jgi:hypothetical protein
MPFQRPVVRRAAIERIGAYRADCLLWDCEWALRASIVARCALLQHPLYLQRVDGQGYSSRTDRALEHTKSGVEMLRSLLEAAPVPMSTREKMVLRTAYSDALAKLAFEYARRRRPVDSVRAWWKSQEAQPRPLRLRLLASCLARSFGLLRT